jgi:AAA domain
MTNQHIDNQYTQLRNDLIDHLQGNGKLAVVQAPPGSGKTYMLLGVVSELIKSGKRVAIASQTNSQADDIAHRWSRDYPKLKCVRLAGSSNQRPQNFPADIEWVFKSHELPTSPSLSIATAAKWTWMKDIEPFDVLAIDEAWQLPWAELMQCSKISEKFLLIGDPGQIPPVVTIDVRRWATAPRPPHKAAPDVVLEDPELFAVAHVGSLPACRRLPAASVLYVKPFYSFDFVAYAQDSDRHFKLQLSSDQGPLGQALAELATGQPIVLTISTPEEGLPLETDLDIAMTVKDVVEKLLISKAEIAIEPDEKPRPLKKSDIGVTSTHRSMNGEIRKALGADLSEVSIDTPERWQGLERPIMIAVHPLSSVTDPSSFDLETGRLCVMASRHQVGLIMITRDHVGETLNSFIPEAAQAPGAPDAVGRGHFAHTSFWNALEQDGRIFAL